MSMAYTLHIAIYILCNLISISNMTNPVKKIRATSNRIMLLLAPVTQKASMLRSVFCLVKRPVSI